MVVPLLAAAARTAVASGGRTAAAGRASRAGAGARGAAAGEGAASRGSSSTVSRTQEQSRSRVSRARQVRQVGRVIRVHNALNKRKEESKQQEGGTPEAESSQARQRNPETAQERVNRLRFIKAQSILAPAEEASNRIEKEENEKPSLLRYMPAMAVATLKDGLDLVLVGSVPVVGTIISFICSFLIFILLLFTKKNGSIADMRFILRRLLIISVGFIIEGFVFGVNFFPFEIATVFLIYFVDSHLSKKQIAVLKDILGPLNKQKL